MRIDAPSGCSLVAQTNAPERSILTLSVPGDEGRGRKRISPNPLISQGVEADCFGLIQSDSRAGDGARTHDSHVGNVALYR